MNYFGHAALAVLKQGPPDFILGAMLPDLLSMVGGESIKASDTVNTTEHLKAGIRFHLETDALFHQTETFLDLNRRALSLFRQAEISRGPARAAAHMGVEMLFDGQLVKSEAFAVGYLNALEFGAEADELSDSWGSAGKSIKLLCRHLAERGVHIHTATAERFAYRIAHALSGRPRLSPTESEAAAMTTILLDFADLPQKTDSLLDELGLLFQEPYRPGFQGARLGV